jgi:arginine:pyruvate transaminase
MSLENLSSLTKRISGPSSAAWDVGDLASKRILAGEDIIHLGVGDPDLDTPELIRHKLHEAVENGKTHYSPLAGEFSLREAIAEHASSLYQGGVEAGDVIICNGAQGALFSTFLCLTEVGDEVIVLEPYYAPYPAVVTAAGAKMVNVLLDKDAGYPLDLNKIKEAVTPRTKAILVNSPGNPTGAVFDQTVLNELAIFCKKNSIWLISDEVYWSLCFENEHSSSYIMKKCRDTLVVVNSLSKSHAMTGWRIGWAIGPKHFIKAMTGLSQALCFGINQFVQNAAITALSDKNTTADFNSLFRRRRDALCTGLRKSNYLNFAVPSGGMFVLLDISRTGLSGKECAEQLLEEEKVAVVPGFGFGEFVGNTVRVGFLCEEKRLKKAADRIVNFAQRKADHMAL